MAAAAVGGAGLLYARARLNRPAWRDPAGTVRRAGRLNVRVLGEGSDAVVLLHGLIGSNRFWDGDYDLLATGRRLVACDLLGFGGSERPASGYGPDDHAAAVLEALDELGIDGRLLLAAHSLGTVVALRVAAAAPGRVDGIVAFGPPLYPSIDVARARVGASSPMARLFVLPGPLAQRACEWICDHRRLARRASQLLNPSVPPAVAADAVEHSWPSYSESLSRCLLTAEPQRWLAELPMPVTLVAGAADPVVDLDFLHRLAAMPTVEVEVWEGDHRLPLTRSSDCASRILSAATGPPAGSPAA